MIENITGFEMSEEIDLYHVLYQRLKFEQSLGFESVPRNKKLVAEMRELLKKAKPSAKTKAKTTQATSFDEIEKALEKIEDKKTAKFKTKPKIEIADISIDELTNDKEFSNMELSPEDKKLKIDELHRKILQCQRCDTLVKNRNMIVPGDGNINSPLVFVGEAPGADEDREGIPFIGRAGKKLTEIIENGMKIPRKEVFICNVLKCRPPGNRDPQPDEIENCRGFLKKQLEIIHPKVIFALGAYAARFLTNQKPTFPLGKLRGTFHKYEDTDILVAATYHPSYLIQYYTKENRQKVLEDTTMVLDYLKEQGIYPWF